MKFVSAKKVQNAKLNIHKRDCAERCRNQLTMNILMVFDHNKMSTSKAQCVRKKSGAETFLHRQPLFYGGAMKTT
jgi:hypothetical protein